MDEIVTALSEAGLHVEWLHEFDWLYYKLSAEKQRQDEKGNCIFPNTKRNYRLRFR